MRLISWLRPLPEARPRAKEAKARQPLHNSLFPQPQAVNEALATTICMRPNQPLLVHVRLPCASAHLHFELSAILVVWQEDFGFLATTSPRFLDLQFEHSLVCQSLEAESSQTAADQERTWSNYGTQSTSSIKVTVSLGCRVLLGPNAKALAVEAVTEEGAVVSG